MLKRTREGKMRARLCEAILAGFNPVSLDLVLRENDMLRPNVALGPDFTTRVHSLIDVAHEEGWLIELCGVLADARAGNQRVNSALVAVQKWLIDQRDSNEVDFQFQHDVLSKRSVGFRYLPLLSIMIAAALIGVAAWAIVDKKEPTQQSISTTGPQSPVVTGTKGKVQIDFSKSQEPLNAVAPPPMNVRDLTKSQEPLNAVAPPPINAPMNAQQPRKSKALD
jgi:effector-associated domain 1 (EAD1)-containing protein